MSDSFDSTDDFEEPRPFPKKSTKKKSAPLLSESGGGDVFPKKKGPMGKFTKNMEFDFFFHYYWQYGLFNV